MKCSTSSSTTSHSAARNSTTTCSRHPRGRRALRRDGVGSTNRIGDEHGLRFENGQVQTPPGFKEAYDRYCRTAGSRCAPTAVRRPGPARGFALAFSEMLISGNMAWKMYSGLTESAALTIQAHGSDELKARYLPKMVSASGRARCASPRRTRAATSHPAHQGRTARRRLVRDHRHQDLHHRRRARPDDNIVHLVLAACRTRRRGPRASACSSCRRCW